MLQPLARGWPLSLRRPRGTALNQPGEALEDRGGSPLACQRTEPFSVPRQRSGRGPGPLAGPPPPSQPLSGRPRLVPNALPRAHGGDTEGGAEGSGDAVRLAGNPLRVRLGGRVLQAVELWGTEPLAAEWRTVTYRGRSVKLPRVPSKFVRFLAERNSQIHEVRAMAAASHAG